MIKEGIKDYLGKILTSENLSDNEFQTLLSLLDSSFGKDYLVKNIYQSKFKENYFQTLSDKSLEYMYKVLFSVLLNLGKVEENEKNLEFGILLTKSSFFYAK